MSKVRCIEEVALGSNLNTNLFESLILAQNERWRRA